jgi:polysaccharide biosynthesis protein PslH
MRVLQVCPKPPIPAVDGGCIAMLAACNALLAHGHEVKIFTAETSKHPVSLSKDFEDLKCKTEFEACFIDTQVKPLPAFFNLFTNKSYNVSRFDHPGFRQKLINILLKESFDVVQLESIFVAPYLDDIRKHAPKAKIIIRTHNVEHLLWKRLAVQSAFPKRNYFEILSKRLEVFEIDILKKSDAIASISSADTAFFKEILKDQIIETIPVNIPVPGNTEISKERNLLFLGSFDWKPNVEGVERFLKETWPGLIKTVPHATLLVAGRKMPSDWQKRSGEGVSFLGEVTDKFSFFNKGQIFIAPLYSGSGIRIKILEAMALGKVVITTPLGAEGLDCKHGQHMFIAHSPADFIAVIHDLLNDQNKCIWVGQSAHQFVKSNFSEETAGLRFTNLFEQICSPLVKAVL